MVVYPALFFKPHRDEKIVYLISKYTNKGRSPFFIAPLQQVCSNKDASEERDEDIIAESK